MSEPVPPKRSGALAMVGALLAGALLSSALLLLFELTLFYVRLDRNAEELRSRWELVPGLVYSRDLAAGEPADEEALLDFEIPRALSSSRIAHPSDRSKALGRRLSAAVKAGDMVRFADFGEPRPGQLAAPTGVPFEVQLGHGSQNLRAGDVVDLVRSEAPGEIRIVAEGATVHAFGRFAPPGPISGDAAVLLDVPAPEAAAVEEALASGRLWPVVHPRNAPAPLETP